MILQVNSVATEHFLDDELIPGLKDILLVYKLLDKPKDITALSQRAKLGTVSSPGPSPTMTAINIKQ